MTCRPALRYTNPVFDRYFADPFVWRHGDEYFAVGTGPGGAREGALFTLLRSTDFVHWRAHGPALVRPEAALGATFWAPEVAYHDGTFFLYYSVGHGDRGHQLRVATSASPLGPYRDAGCRLGDPDETFAIDPHPFRDDDGRWYLFYARDFLDSDERNRPGTALVVQRLEGMTKLGEGAVVMRARHDWQRFERDRCIYGSRFDWHTLEGPAVYKRNGRYYCFYSGGRWETEHYGVDYAVADNVLGPYVEAGGGQGPRVLCSAEGRLLGPGHNSLVMGPDGTTPYFAYHAWDPQRTARRMCLDPLLWEGDVPRCDGPSWSERTVLLDR